MGTETLNCIGKSIVYEGLMNMQYHLIKLMKKLHWKINNYTSKLNLTMQSKKVYKLIVFVCISAIFGLISEKKLYTVLKNDF